MKKNKQIQLKKGSIRGSNLAKIMGRIVDEHRRDYFDYRVINIWCYKCVYEMKREVGVREHCFKMDRT